MRPPAANSWPRFKALPCGALTFTLRLGAPVSRSSTLWPAARTIWPPGASIKPSLRRLAPTSMTRPRSGVRSSPKLTISALPAPPEPPPRVKVKALRPALQSLSARFSVDTTSPATSTRAPGPNSTPFGFSNQTLPLLLRRPRTCDGSLPVTRFSTALLALA